MPTRIVFMDKTDFDHHLGNEPVIVYPSAASCREGNQGCIDECGIVQVIMNDDVMVAPALHQNAPKQREFTIYDRFRIAKVTNIIIDGEPYDFNELLEIVEELNTTSYGMNHLAIYNRRVEELLIRRGLADKSVRGSCAKTEKTAAFLQELYDAQRNRRNLLKRR